MPDRDQLQEALARRLKEALPPDYEAAAKQLAQRADNAWAKLPPVAQRNYRNQAFAAVAAALRVEPGTQCRVIVVKDDGQTQED